MLKKIFLAYVIFFSLTCSILVFVVWFSQPAAVVVPHHDIVKDLRQNFLQRISSKRLHTQTVVLLSPDHFSPNQHQITYSDKTWNLSNGELEFDEKMGAKVVFDFQRDNELLLQDHGIFNILPDIKASFPEAKVVPIIIGQEVELSMLDGLIRNLIKNCNKNCLLITSVDFSHYLPEALADVHDAETLSVLNNLNVASDFQLEVDSNQSLYVLTQFAKFRRANYWKIYAHTNSGEIANNRDVEGTSHVMGWYEKKLLFQPAKNHVQSFLMANNLEQKRDEKSLGERFFYGVDLVELNLIDDFTIDHKLQISPSSQPSSSVEFVDDVLKIELGSDIAVMGFSSDSQIYLVFSPLVFQDGAYQLMRGEEKSQYFEELFQKIDNHSVGVINTLQQSSKQGLLNPQIANDSRQIFLDKKRGVIELKSK